MELPLHMQAVDCGHRRRIETENKAKSRRFGLGVKIECRTRKFWCESVTLCVLYVFPLLLLGGMFYVDLYFEFLYRNSKKSQYNTIGLQYLPECRKIFDGKSIDL